MESFNKGISIVKQEAESLSTGSAVFKSSHEAKGDRIKMLDESMPPVRDNERQFDDPIGVSDDPGQMD